MSENLKVVRLQLLDERTGEPLDYVDVATRASAVSMSDGAFLEDVIKSMTTKLNKNTVDAAKLIKSLENHISGDTHVDPTKLSKTFTGFTYDETTGVVTFKLYDGTNVEWDTLMEKIALDVEFDGETNELVFTMADGKETRVNVTKLADLYSGEETETTTTGVSDDNKVTVNIKEASLTMGHLATELQTLLTNAKNFIDNYEAYELPEADAETLGGIKLGEGLEKGADGKVNVVVETGSNISYGEDSESAVAASLYMEVVSVGGSSTDTVPTVEEGKSYYVSNGDHITYSTTDGTYAYYSYSTDGTSESGLDLATVQAKLVPGAELIDATTVVTQHDNTYNYAVTESGDGFVYTQNLTTTFVEYLTTERYVELINSGTLNEGWTFSGSMDIDGGSTIPMN